MRSGGELESRGQHTLNEPRSEYMGALAEDYIL